MGLCSLVGIVFMMLATIVVTREPDGDTDVIATDRKRKNAAQAPRRAGQSLSMAGGPQHR
jgi:hypothetical protein